MLQLTPNAASHIEQKRPRHDRFGDPCDHLLRLTGQGCRPGSVRLAYVARARDGDHVGESHGIPVCVASDVVDLLDEMVLDRRPGETGPLYFRPAG